MVLTIQTLQFAPEYVWFILGDNQPLNYGELQCLERHWWGILGLAPGQDAGELPLGTGRRNTLFDIAL